MNLNKITQRVVTGFSVFMISVSAGYAYSQPFEELAYLFPEGVTNSTGSARYFGSSVAVEDGIVIVGSLRSDVTSRGGAGLLV